MHVTPHPLACVLLQPLDKPPFFPSFHPATNTVTALLTYMYIYLKKNTAIHPTLPGKKNRPVPSQPAKGPERRVRLHPSAECCCCSSEALPRISRHTHTHIQTDGTCSCVCVQAAEPQTDTYCCPLPFPDLPAPHAISSIARRLPGRSEQQQQQPQQQQPQ